MQMPARQRPTRKASWEASCSPAWYRCNSLLTIYHLGRQNPSTLGLLCHSWLHHKQWQEARCSRGCCRVGDTARCRAWHKCRNHKESSHQEKRQEGATCHGPQAACTCMHFMTWKKASNQSTQRLSTGCQILQHPFKGLECIQVHILICLMFSASSSWSSDSKSSPIFRSGLAWSDEAKQTLPVTRGISAWPVQRQHRVVEKKHANKILPAGAVQHAICYQSLSCTCFYCLK